MNKIGKEKIKNFLLTNQQVRRVKVIFYQKFLPIFTKFSLAAIAVLVLILVSLKLFKPAYLEKIKRKSSFYFFHYLHLDNYDFNQINISGNSRVSKEEVIQVINQTKANLTKNDEIYYQPLVQNLIDKLKEKLPWIKKVIIARSMPDTLNITLEEYEPFAIWQSSAEKYIIDKEGNLIPFEDLEEFKNMVILSGSGANLHAKSLFNIFVIDPELSANVYSATWVGNRRWDIRFENGLLIKLPENNISAAWQQLIKIYGTNGSIIGLKIIDLRISDKVYLEYEGSVVKELMSS
jgi:cell division protein FtsQ